MLNTAKIIAFAATCDPARARDFYERALGLTLLADEPFALVFDANGTMLRVSKMQTLSPQPFTVLGWQVPDIGAAVEALRASGVDLLRPDGFLLDERGVWVMGETRIAWFKDPDGNVLSITEF